MQEQLIRYYEEERKVERAVVCQFLLFAGPKANLTAVDEYFVEIEDGFVCTEVDEKIGDLEEIK